MLQIAFQQRRTAANVEGHHTVSSLPKAPPLCVLHICRGGAPKHMFSRFTKRYNAVLLFTKSTFPSLPLLNDVAAIYPLIWCDSAPQAGRNQANYHCKSLQSASQTCFYRPTGVAAAAPPSRATQSIAAAAPPRFPLISLSRGFSQPISLSTQGTPRTPPPPYYNNL